jgi:hypothetical protein
MINGALRTILPFAGWPEERARAVEITGGTDPFLPKNGRGQCKIFSRWKAGAAEKLR